MDAASLMAGGAADACVVKHDMELAELFNHGITQVSDVVYHYFAG